MDELDSFNAVALGRLITRRRLELGITQDYLAQLTGLNQSTVSRLERGAAPHLPAPLTMAMLTQALQCSLQELLAAAGYVETARS